MNHPSRFALRMPPLLAVDISLDWRHATKAKALRHDRGRIDNVCNVRARLRFVRGDILLVSIRHSARVSLALQLQLPLTRCTHENRIPI